MRIGVIFCGYQCADLLPESLAPWVAARAARLGGDQYVICCVSVPFTGFDHGNEEPDATRSLLGIAAHEGSIDHAIVSDKPMAETEARGRALKWLVEQGVEATWIVDGDEAYTATDIERIAAFIKANEFVPCFRLSLRNCVFTRSQWLAEPFTPMRIHRVHAPGGYKADNFYDDNNVRYWRPWEREKMSGQPVMDVQMATMTVPAIYAWIEHVSWLSNLRSKRKCEYQEHRWGPPRGNGCSFAWDDSRGGLVWNDAFFKRTGLPIPEVIHG